MLENMFMTIIKMSATASIAAVMIILLRLIVGRKLPKTFYYAAWAIVLIRLLVPFSISTGFSVFNFIPSYSGEEHQQVNMHQYEEIKTIRNADVNAGVSVLHQDTTFNDNFDNPVNVLEDEKGINNTTGNIQSQNENDTKGSNIQELSATTAIAFIWLSISLVLLGFCIYAYLKTSKRLKTAVLFDDNGLVEECSSKLNFNRKTNVFTSERVDTPVVAGIANVRIILPAFLVNKCDSKDLKYVITHELVHIKRHDNIIKLLAVLAVCIHWFNPLIWISFMLFQKDMEMSCDARVLSVYKNDVRKKYAESLLNIATKQNALLYGGLLGFGESNIKDRIKGIMKFKNYGIWMKIFLVIILVIFGFILLTNGKINDTDKDNTYSSNLQEVNGEDSVNKNTTMNENDEFNELKIHITAMEELMVRKSNFQYMNEDQIEEILRTLPEIIRDNYRGVGRIENNDSGYILLTCKSGAKRLPEDASTYERSFGSTKISQQIMEDSQGKEICRFPQGMYVSYYTDKDILFIAVGDMSPNMDQIMQIEVFQLSGYQDYINYAKKAKERGSSIFNTGVYPQIVTTICVDGIKVNEYVSVAEAFGEGMKEKLESHDETSCDTSTLIQTGIAILLGEEDEKSYELCLLPDGTKVIHKYHEKDKVIINNGIYDSIMDIAGTRTAWEWVELYEIHDIVQAEMRMKLGRDSEEQIQVVEDSQSLKELETLFSNAKYCGLTGCPFTASLFLTRKDGKVITLQIATDSCDTMILGTSAGYDYGPEPRGPGIEGTVNRQDVLKRIFYNIEWERTASLGSKLSLWNN